MFRKELKYVISEKKFLQIQNMLEQVMELDAHSIDGSYMVRSQYYDSITDADLYDNLDGVWEKQKIRVRIYSVDDNIAKLECKCKKGTDGKKHTLLLSKEEALLMEQHKYDFLLKREEKLAQYLYAKLTEQVYFPKTIVEYQRTAYKYPVSDVRVTYDRNVRGGIHPYGIFQQELSYAPLLNIDEGVLEIKYNDFFPAILKSMIGNIDSVAEACSKYSMSRLNCI